jgi:penicillin amidase
MRDLMVPEEARKAVGNPPMSRIVAWLEAPDGRFGPDPIKGRDDLLVKSLTDAVEELKAKLGEDMRTWALGAYHYARILSPFASAVTPELEEKYDVGKSPRGGDSYTIDATGSGDNQNAGGSFKIVMDTENWDNSVGLNNPGQSGNVDDPHYRDLFEYWGRGKYFPVFFSRPKVESVTEKKLTLSPR